MFSSDETKSKYKHIEPESLANFGLLTSSRNGGYTCPLCGNGDGEDGTGVDWSLLNDGYKGFCHRCGEYFDVFDVIGAKYHYSTKTQFFDIVDKAKEIFGDSPKISNPPKKADKEKPNYMSLIINAAKGLDMFFSDKDSWRGLTESTLRKFRCGFLPAWMDGTARIIISDCFEHYLARYPYETDDPKIKVKPHRGTKHIFGLQIALKALQEKPNSLVYITEGEIDAMSISQSGYTAIAFGGSDISAFQQTLLEKNFPKDTKFILLFDNDETGKKKAPKAQKILGNKGFKVYVAFFRVGIEDANALLQKNPDELKAELGAIYLDAENFFSPPDPLAGIVPTEVEGVNEITHDYKPEEAETVSDKTCLQIPTCPLDLSVPEKFQFSPKGLFVMTLDKKTKKDIPIQFTTTPIIPTRILQKEDKSGTEIELAYYERFENKWHKLTVPMTTIAKTQNIAELADYGVDINTPHAREMSNFLMKIQRWSDNAMTIPKIKIYEQTGWTTNDCEEFIYPPDEKITITDDDAQTDTAVEKIIVEDNGYNFAGKFTSKGDPQDWYYNFFVNYIGHIAVRFALGEVLAAPILRICKARNWQGILVAPSGSSKSAVAKLAMSVFGDPEKLHVTFDGTPNGLTMIGTMANDLPTWIDEYQAADRKVRENFETFIYNYAEGQTRTKLNRNSEIRKQYSFNGTRLFTSEEAVIRDNFMQGAVNRIIELKGFRPLKDRLGRELHENLKDTFGHFGKSYIEYVGKYADEVRETYEYICAEYQNMGFIDAHLQHIATIYTAQEYFWRMLREFTTEDGKKLDGLDGIPTPLEILAPQKTDSKNLEDQGDIIFYRNLLPSPEESNVIIRARNFLSEILASRYAEFDQLQDANDGKAIWKAESPNKDTGSLGCIMHDRTHPETYGDVLFYPFAIDRLLTSKGYPPAKTVMAGLAAEGFMEVGNGTLGKAFKKSVRLAERGAKKGYYVKKSAFDSGIDKSA